MSDIGRERKVWHWLAGILSTVPSLPVIFFFDTRQWLTGFFNAFSFPPKPCKFGDTNISYIGSHSVALGVPSVSAVPFSTNGAEITCGSLGVNGPSSLSRSYTTIVPSAKLTKNKFVEDGTHLTAVHALDVVEKVPVAFVG